METKEKIIFVHRCWLNSGFIMKLQLLGHSQCHLCHEAEKILQILKKKYPIVIEWIDINTTPDFEKYRKDIPVILLDGSPVCEYYVDVDKIISLCSHYNNPSTIV